MCIAHDLRRSICAATAHRAPSAPSNQSASHPVARAHLWLHGANGAALLERHRPPQTRHREAAGRKPAGAPQLALFRRRATAGRFGYLAHPPRGSGLPAPHPPACAGDAKTREYLGEPFMHALDEPATRDP